jgi:hypothetical protein
VRGPSKRVRRPSNFRQQDVSRAVAACQGRGLEIYRVEVDPNTAKISIVVKRDSPETEVITVNPFDTAPLPDEPARRTRKTK